MGDDLIRRGDALKAIPTGWTGQPYQSNMDFGPNVSAQAKTAIAAIPAASAEDVRAGALKDLEPIDVGGVGNYYGGLMIMAKDGQPFWCIENWDGCDWQPCPIDVFTALRALIPEAKP